MGRSLLGTVAPLLALAGLTLVACAGEEPAGELAIELGTGEWQFEPLVDGQSVRLVHGAQGGWHVWTSVRTTGVDPEHVRLELGMRLADDPEADWDTSRIDVRMVEDGDALAYLGYPFVVPRPACVVGRPLELRATLTDAHGRRGSDACMIVTDWVPVEGTPTTCDAP